MRDLVHILFWGMCALAVASCRKPSAMEFFVLNENRGEDGLYRYELDLSDSLATYDVYLYSRIDEQSSTLSQLDDIPMAAYWTAPDGEVYKDSFYFPVRDAKKGFFSSEYKLLYREGIAPVQRGKWRLHIDVAQYEGVPVLRGLGVAYKTIKD